MRNFLQFLEDQQQVPEEQLLSTLQRHIINMITNYGNEFKKLLSQGMQDVDDEQFKNCLEDFIRMMPSDANGFEKVDIDQLPVQDPRKKGPDYNNTVTMPLADRSGGLPSDES